MEYFHFGVLLVSALLFISTTSAQSGASNSTDNSTSNSTDGSSSSTTSNSTDGGSSSTTSNSTDGGSSTTTSDASAASATGTNGNTVALSDNCQAILESCNSPTTFSESSCEAYMSTLKTCLQAGVGEGSTKMTCIESDFAKMKWLCFRKKFKNYASAAGVSQSCVARAGEVVGPAGSWVPDISLTKSYCQFVDFEEDFLMEPELSSAVCTRDEFDAFLKTTCNSCKETIASFGLVALAIVVKYIL